MRKEYIKITSQTFDENMNPIDEVKESVYSSIIADDGKIFHCLRTGFVGGTRIDIGDGDSEENYEEVNV